MIRHLFAAALATGLLGLMGPAAAVELNPKAVTFKLPDQIPWKAGGSPGVEQAIMAGDPSKPGLYVVLTKWKAGNNFSRPHFHPNDRFISVISGVWWVGTGTKFDPNNTVAMPAGTFVTHFAKEIHWDGAKDVDAILMIVGDGPATSTRVPETQ